MSVRRRRNPEPGPDVYGEMNTPTATVGRASNSTGSRPASARPPDDIALIPADGGPDDRPATGEIPIVSVTAHQAAPEFSAFYRQHWSGIARGLALTLGNPDLAAEATDEAMARAYPRWATLQFYDNPAGWVYRVGLNWARSYHKRAARLMPFAHRDAVDPVAVTDPAIAEALAALDIKQRSVVVCRLFLDWSVAETAAALDISPGTVKSRLHRALQNLETSLAHLR
jgi:DNA-directed RNA polymerase specialized sigma24 family protein